MKDLLISILEPLGYPIFLQGSLGADETYPETFFTFWNNDVPGDEFYDNNEHSYVWDFDLNCYSSVINADNTLLVNTLLLEAKTLLRENGFIVNGKGYDVISDDKTHTGRGINVLKIEK
jgi:hypothetical protein